MGKFKYGLALILIGTSMADSESIVAPMLVVLIGAIAVLLSFRPDKPVKRHRNVRHWRDMDGTTFSDGE